MLFLLNLHIIRSQVVRSNSHVNYTVRIREVSCWSKSDSKPKENKSFLTLLYSYFPLIIIFAVVSGRYKYQDNPDYILLH